MALYTDFDNAENVSIDTSAINNAIRNIVLTENARKFVEF